MAVWKRGMCFVVASETGELKHVDDEVKQREKVYESMLWKFENDEQT